MNDNWIKKGKEVSPEETIARIESIICELGYNTEYIEVDVDIEGCYSSRVSFSDPGLKGIAANGKGTTPLYAKASAYAELMERLENRIFLDIVSNTPEFLKQLTKIYRGYKQKKWEDYDGLHPAVQNDIDKIVKSVNAPVWIHNSIRKKALSDIAEATKSETYFLETYWDYRHNKETELPMGWVKSACGSNGMAAGNTIAEAIVQAASEILERYVTFQFLDGKVRFPEIPETVLNGFEYVKKIKQRIQEKGNYVVRLYDASMGKGIPVVCSLIINKDTGNNSFKLGSHPIMEVAIERLFTETLQGVDLEFATTRSSLSFAAPDEDNRMNNFNAVKLGVGNIPVSFFFEKPSYDYCGWDQTDAYDNRKMAKKMLDILDEISGNNKGSGVYINDVSFLGFPVVQIYVPGVSESYPVDKKSQNKKIRGQRIHQVFSNEIVIDENALNMILTQSVDEIEDLYVNTFPVLSMIPFASGYPKVEAQMELMASFTSYALGKYSIASSFMSKVIAKESNSSSEITILNAYKMVMESKVYGISDLDIRRILHELYSDEIAEKVIWQLLESETVLERVYPFCSREGCDNCSNSCKQKALEKLYLTLDLRKSEFDKSNSKFFQNGTKIPWL